MHERPTVSFNPESAKDETLTNLADLPLAERNPCDTVHAVNTAPGKGAHETPREKKNHIFKL